MKKKRKEIIIKKITIKLKNKIRKVVLKTNKYEFVLTREETVKSNFENNYRSRTKNLLLKL